jgi:hypothetical protein
MREAAKEGARFHHDHHIPKHFKSGAASRYGYKQRSAIYWRWRKKMFHGWGRRLHKQLLPLVLTGQLMGSVTGLRQIRATSTRGATLVMFGEVGGNEGLHRRKDPAAIIRLMNAGKISKSRGYDMLSRMKNGTGMTQSQQNLHQISAEISAYTNDEVVAIAKEEERVYAKFAGMPRLTRRTTV